MNMQLSDPQHPIWSLLRMALLIFTLYLCLAYGYNTWDAVKDPRTIIIIAIMAGGTEVLTRLLTGNRDGRN